MPELRLFCGKPLGGIDLDHVKARLLFCLVLGKIHCRSLAQTLLLAPVDKFHGLGKFCAFAQLDLDKNQIFLILRDNVDLTKAAR